MRMQLTKTADALVMRAHRPDALDLAQVSRVVTVSVIAACGVYAIFDRAARDEGIWMLTMLFGSGLLFIFGQFHLIVAVIERRSAFQRARREVEIARRGDQAVLRIDGRDEVLPDRLLIAQTVVRRGPGRIGLAWGVCCAFEDRIVMLDELDELPAAVELTKRLEERLRLPGQARDAAFAPVEFTPSFTALAGAATLPELLLIPATLVWVVEGAPHRAIVGPFLILLLDLAIHAAIVRIGMWSARRRVREVLASL